MRMRPTLSWTPTGEPPAAVASLDDVAEVVAAGGVLVLSGAGLSTESGIPDYRGDTGSLNRHTPMTYQEFVDSVDGRQRYWARSHLGWRTIARARPNSGHLAVAELQARGHLGAVLTQNVDGLHQAAGATGVVELHGSLDRVICLGCKRISPREDLDRRLRAANPGFTAETTRINPDGDVDLPAAAVRGFALVDCASCGGVLKPDVVFFGENVPAARVRQCYDLVDAAEAVLVLGSSLTVMSGLRFVRHAAKAGKPVLIINQGRTRGDRHARGRVDMPLGIALTDLARRLT
ncbi:NAD-dependent protein deacetylase [Allokutzneria sp. A3M-2-11 16]|uniref:NAD-dependent protein deacetylase n=1 Tax=Allokutzneria sp. A3M-2-11 16 TaxID=2962043 RepID=UPI0020B6F06E|nr:NAD-dependent protein deacetylase [Allokutzneria sp. A3M-2-11 16]MCP3803054.1 NAD-dependent protein deacetylase [Allokutzneria sp. A3M-2-11 16]